VKLLRVILWVALLAFAASLSFQKIRSYDYWWHLKTGSLIAQTGSFPRVDPYSFTAPGAPWINIHWLHQLGLHALHSAGGHGAVVFGKFLLVALLIGILASIGYRRERPAITVAALALMLVVAGDRFMPRPELTSFVLLAAVLALLERHERKGDAWLFGIVAIQLVWANVQSLFALGIVICGITFAGEFVRPLLRIGQPLRVDRLLQLGALGVLALLACFANPNGIEGASFPLQQLRVISLPSQRAALGLQALEMASPLRNAHLVGPIVLGAFAVLGVLSGAAMALNWRRVRPAEPLLWCAFLLLALAAIRNMAPFAIVAVPLLVRNTNELIDARGHPKRGWRMVSVVLAVALVLLAVDTARGRFFPRMGSPRVPGLGVMETFYPIGAAEWIAERRPPAPLAHHMADGGYLIWRLFPDYRVLSDGRQEVYRAKLDVLWLVDENSFQQLDRRYRFGTVLVHYGDLDLSDLLKFLYRSPDWQLAFVDEVAAVFVRRLAGSEQSDIDVDAPDLFPAREDERSYEDAMRRIGQARFHAAVGRPHRSREILREARALYPHWLQPAR
jgi:hypothetical protein